MSSAKNKKQKEETFDSLRKKAPKIIHFNEIPSVEGAPLEVTTFRNYVNMSTIGIIEASEAKAHAIFSYKITPDIHKVVVSNLNNTLYLDPKKREKVLIGLSVKDISPETDSSDLKKSIKTQLMINGFSEKDAENEVNDKNVSREIKNCADPFIGSNNIFLQSVIRVKEYADGKNYEFIIPPSIFDGRKEVYLFVSCNETPKVVPYTYPNNRVYFYKEPAAEALYVGDKLSDSKILFGEVHDGKKTLRGLFLWQKIFAKVKANGEDVQTLPALFLSLKKKSHLRPISTVLDNEIFKKAKKKTITEKVLLTVLQKIRKRYSIELFTCDIKLPVYTKDTNQFYSFVWRTNDTAKGEFIEKDLSHPQKHQTYKSLFDNYGLGEIYNSPASFSYTSPTYAAEQIARGLLAQPKGKRSISIDGFLWELMGGVILEAQNNTFVHKTINPIALIDSINSINSIDSPELIALIKAYTPYKNKDIRLTRDYLFSMAYSTPAKDSTKDSFSGEGYLFFDSPIHYNNPKVAIGREIDQEFAKELKKHDHDFVYYLISCKERIKRAKNYFSEWLNIGDPDDPSDLRPSSGCHAAKDLLHDIFKKIHSFGIEINYVYSDIEQIYNTAWVTKTHGRIEHCHSSDTETSNCFNIGLYQTDGKLDFTKMWNAICETKRFQKEIVPELESRGFHTYQSSKGTGDIYLSAVNKALWIGSPTKWPSFRYCLFNDFATRRELNIWDCVMMEYTANVQQKYLMDEVIKLNPNAKYSVYAHYSAKGYSHYGLYSMLFEPSLGGSITLPQKMSSCTSIYGGRPSEGHCKFNLYDYRCFVNDKSAFALFKYEINHIRILRNDNPNGFMPFFSCQDFRKFHDEELDQSTFYKDTLFHTWMCQPNQMIAYFNYDGDIKSNYEKKNLAEKDYYTKCFQDTQKILNELNSIISAPIVKTLKTPIVNENDPYILTGVETATKRIWRLTLDTTKKITKKLIKSGLNLTIDNTSIVFNTIILSLKDETGYWIITAKDIEPDITKHELLPSYYAENPFNSEPNLFTKINSNVKGHSFYHSRDIMVFGENAPNQTWEAKIMFDKTPSSGNIFKVPVSKLSGIKANKWYTFTANVCTPKLEDYEDERDLQTKITLTYTGDGVTRTLEHTLSTTNKYKPIDYIELGNGSGTVNCEYFKINIAGKNIRADIFRESDGVNITRVNKNIDEFKNTNLADTFTSDTLKAKISWLNATDEDEKYTVSVQQIPERVLILIRNNLGTVTAKANEQGYEILDIPKLRGDLSAILISVRDSKENTVFSMRVPIKRVLKKKRKTNTKK